MATMTKEAKALAELEAERGRLAARVVQLEGDREEAPVKKLAGIASELASLRETLPILDGRVKLARVELKAAREVEKEAAAVALRPREAKAFDAVKDALGPLEAALADLDAVRDKLRLLGAGGVGHTLEIANGVRLQRVQWKRIANWEYDRVHRAERIAKEAAEADAAWVKSWKEAEKKGLVHYG